MRLHLILLKNWWVVVCLLMAGAIYIQAVHKKNARATALIERLGQLVQAKEKAEEIKEELLLRIHSQNDPEFIELVLKEKLGVVSEGETKVVFQ